MTFKNYTLKRDKETGNYRIQPPNALWWREQAVNLATAKRWVDQHISERETRMAHAGCNTQYSLTN